MRSSRKFVVAAVVAVVAALGGVAVGSTLAATSVGGSSIERINVARGTETFHSSSTSYADVAGATVRITVPEGHRSFVLARFTTQVDCTAGDGNPNGSCMARILLGSGELQPGATSMDSIIAGQSTGVRSAALDRSSAMLAPGTYTVKVQARVTSPLMIAELTDWHLTVERVEP